jgi:undecaprenyl-diphosphatase
MSFLESILLGIVQAVTEFFPVSSSAHLKILKHFLGLQNLENYVLFDLSCHFGTLIALLIFLRSELKKLFFEERKKLILFFIALLPLIPCYFLLKPLRDLASDKHFLGICLMGSGLILLAGQSLRMPRSKNRGLTTNIQDVLMIGTMQSAALIPGISRSAATISCARVLGWSAKDAVRFSFLLSIPTIIGGNLIEILKTAASSPIEQVPVTGLLTAFATSFLLGLALVGKAIRFLEQGNLKTFAWYCLILGAAATLYFNL